MSETLLRDIAEFCRGARMAESTFGRLAVNDGKLVSRLRLGGRVTTDTVDRVRAFIAREPPRAVNGVPVAIAHPPAEPPGHHHPQLPLLRQPAEIPAVRHHLRREVGHCPTRRHGAGEHPPAAAGVAAVRCRHGRRHRAGAHHAGDAQPLPHHAVLHRRQGDQPRGRAPGAGEDARPAVRASGDRAGDDQHVLFRGAVAEAELGQRRHQPGLARAVADREHGARVRNADHRSRPVPRRELARPGEPQQRQPGVRKAGGAGDLSRGPQVPARPGAPAPRLHRGGIRSGDRLAALSRARAAGVQGAPRGGAAGARAGAGRAADRHPFARRRSWPGDHPAHLAGREPVHHRSPRSAARDQGGTRQCRARPEFRRLCRCALAVPLRHAHAAERDQRHDRHFDAVRGVECRGLCRADRGPAPVRGDQQRRLSRGDQGGAAASMAGCGSGTNPT